MEEINRILPQNIEAEQTLLGCIISSIDKFLEVDAIVHELDFYIDKHKKIYGAIKNLVNKGVTVDVITLIEELKSKNMLMVCGGASYITELSLSGINYSNIASYAKIIREKSNRRKLIKAGQTLISKSFDEDINLVLEETEKELYNVEASKESNEIVPISEAVEKSLELLEERYKTGGKLKGISTGFKELDELSSGLKEKDFIIVAARPSMGKTAFALNIGQAASKHGSVAIFSLEMSRDQLMDRLLAAKCMIQFTKITDGTLNEKEFLDISNGANNLGTRKLFIDDEASLLSDIKAKCRKLKLQQGLNVVIIDYLQLIRVNIKTNSREQEVSHISRELKALAKELGITVIALSQLSRAPEQRVDHRPMLSDLRESGSIEQDADIIHFLYRDEYYNKESEDRNIAEVITAKNRNGITRTTKLAWLGQYQRFGTLDVIRR
ncbi:replicative DNA helicase [Clostridium botulinum]|uniref:Replicative DNA helicase n=1 Tax=Clostridium botulinum TaxID=1491 RepID=A0A6B4JIY4_CLOBO|nr:replicative DNA helicase [Clostridium botulinum]EES48885.1 replicative DNA helicase [Clostridium botulinum E1 str. 'BoNT E Beluga']MBY6760557.1 replicative DNA helicase [Clostridium botulinum]MBY6919464.1 replicative DNA helicase [Clostridium botulinum]MCR1130342.1 replicative DNA helicase [Clostridium botulinum]NFJ56900.1 replicative DNA helicase [Clostridium botulinum]